jgi:hypothetical protein
MDMRTAEFVQEVVRQAIGLNRAEERTSLQAILERLDRIEQRLAIAVEKEVYTTEEVAERLTALKRKVTPWTVRQWCNLGQVPGAKKVRGQGRNGEWRIPHEALLRLQNEGPLPAPTRQAA